MMSCLLVDRTSAVTVVGSYQWPDTADIFEREPFMVRFRASNHGQSVHGHGLSVSRPIYSYIYGQATNSVQ